MASIEELWYRFHSHGKSGIVSYESVTLTFNFLSALINILAHYSIFLAVVTVLVTGMCAFYFFLLFVVAVRIFC